MDKIKIYWKKFLIIFFEERIYGNVFIGKILFRKLQNAYYKKKNQKSNIRKAIRNYLFEMQLRWWSFTCRWIENCPVTYGRWTTKNYRRESDVIKMSDEEFKDWLRSVGWDANYPDSYHPVNDAVKLFIRIID